MDVTTIRQTIRRPILKASGDAIRDIIRERKSEIWKAFQYQFKYLI